ncbi:MAG: hypothetical protein HYT98_03790 [Candidatus Sungbacteria bacterium]|nr:hypothetical protein [Candidatus Sungbacteria bacterium]
MRISFALVIIMLSVTALAHAQTPQQPDMTQILQQLQQFQQLQQGGAGGLPGGLDPSLFGGIIPQVQFTSLSATPSSPNPQEKFTVKAQIPSADANSVNFSWTVSGRARSDLSGRGKHTIELVAGEAGSALRIDVRATPPGKDTETASLAVYVSDLALVWQADTYVPRWYKGKALPSSNSEIIVTALPKISLAGSAIRPENLIYQWSIDNTERALSGVGVNVFRFKTGAFSSRLHWIRVAVEDTQKRIRKTGELLIAPQNPRAVIYAFSPLGGIEPRSTVSNFSVMKDALVDLLAEPFFFAGKSRNNFSFSWDVGGSGAGGTPENPYILSVDTRGTRSSNIPVSVAVDDGDIFTAPAIKSGVLKIQ